MGQVQDTLVSGSEGGTIGNGNGYRIDAGDDVQHRKIAAHVISGAAGVGN